MVAAFGWQGWEKYQIHRAQSASALYQQLLDASLKTSGKPDTAKVAELYQQLQSEFGGSHYAQYGSLLVAKVAVEEGMTSLRQSALEKVYNGETTLREINRVTFVE